MNVSLWARRPAYRGEIRRRRAPEPASDAARLDRLDREARAIAALNHPHIVTIFSSEESDGIRFLTMELVEGRTLTDCIVSTGLPLGRFLDIAIPLADALTAAHDKHIVHRDLKPANVMIANDGRVKVLDFGLARVSDAGQVDAALPTQAPLTSAGSIVGTMPYMSPEQVEGSPLDPRSDVFSLGVIFYELLSGARPFVGASSAALLSAILRDTPPNISVSRPDVPEVVARLVGRCLAKRPADRVQTARDVYNELRELQRALDQPRSRPAIRQPESSIAVLPFANMSGDKETEYFSDGLAEEIINALARLPALKVTARTSAFAFRGKDVPIDEIGRRLGVDHVLEGSVRKSGERIRVTAQLIKAADGFHVWSERYDRQLDDVFALQDEMAAAIAGQLKIRLAQPGAARRAPQVAAYEAYLQSRHHWYKLTPSAIAKSRELAERALSIDPAYSDAYVGIAAYHFGVAWFGNGDPRQELPKAMAAAVRALELDPQSAGANALAGAMKGLFDFDWEFARAHLERALMIERSPHVVLPYALWYLRPMGRLEDAQAELLGLCEGDPLAAFPRGELAHVLLLMRRYDDAAAAALQALDLEPDYLLAAFALVTVRLQQGRVDEAIAAAERIIVVSGRWLIPLAFLGLAYAAAGRQTETRDVRDEMLAAAERTHVNATSLATIHTALGEIDEAMRWLERAVDQREPIIVATLDSWPIFDPVRSHPRYRDLLRQMRLPERI